MKIILIIAFYFPWLFQIRTKIVNFIVVADFLINNPIQSPPRQIVSLRYLLLASTWTLIVVPVITISSWERCTLFEILCLDLLSLLRQLYFNLTYHNYLPVIYTIRQWGWASISRRYKRTTSTQKLGNICGSRFW